MLVEHGVRIGRTIGSSGYSADETRLRANAKRDVRRSLYPAGLPHQLAAIVADGDRRAHPATRCEPVLDSADRALEQGLPPSAQAFGVAAGQGFCVVRFE